MRVQSIKLLRNIFHRPDLPYTIYIHMQGTEAELKEAQKKIMEIV